MMECSHDELRVHMTNSQTDGLMKSPYIVTPATSAPEEERRVHSKVKEWKR